MNQKPCYQDYAKHAMRFYVNNPVLNAKLPGVRLSDIQNWHACNDTLERFNDKEKALLIGVYKSKCSMNDAVRCIAAQLGVSQGTVWQQMNRFEKEFAKHRGLI